MAVKPIGGDHQYNEMLLPPFMVCKKNLTDEEWNNRVGGDKTFKQEDGWKPSDGSGNRFKKRYKI